MYYIGVDLGGTNLRAGLVTSKGNVIHLKSTPTYRERGYEEVIEDLAVLITDVIEDGNMSVSEIESIGIGVPGSINTKKGTVVYANNLTFRNVPIIEEIRKHINLPVFIQNDANCAALAESIAGAAKNVSDSITITLGTGIGGGIVLNGNIFCGFNDAAGEIGHTVIVSGGEPCTCGRKGCWEAYASATALIRQTKKAAVDNPESLINSLVDNDPNKITARTPFDAEHQNDPTAQRVIEQYITFLSEGLIDLINIFTPELTVMAGGVSNQGENLLDRIRPRVEKYIYFKGDPHTKIVSSELGGEAGIVGAAMLGA